MSVEQQLQEAFTKLQIQKATFTYKESGKYDVILYDSPISVERLRDIAFLMFPVVFNNVEEIILVGKKQ